MKRGDIVTAVLPGAFGKPRPALIVQADLFNDSHASVTIVPITSTIIDAPLFRITVDPSPANGLRKVSQIMIDKVMTLRRERLDKALGTLGDDRMVGVTRALAVWLGIA